LAGLPFRISTAALPVAVFGDTLPGRPSSFPALPSRFNSFQIVTSAVDNLRDPAGNLF